MPAARSFFSRVLDYVQPTLVISASSSATLMLKHLNRDREAAWPFVKIDHLSTVGSNLLPYLKDISAGLKGFCGTKPEGKIAQAIAASQAAIKQKV